MSLKANILANYVSQFYATLIGVLMVPIFLRYMGAEGYGLVGFFALLQAWFQLLDLGFSIAMTREAARCQGGASGAGDFRALLRTVERIFVALGLLYAIAVVAGAPLIAESWLRVEVLGAEEVRQAVALMGLAVVLRWASGLYRGVISGFERQIWLSGFAILMATARFVFVIPFFIVVGTRPVLFFAYQLGVAFLELAVLAIKAHHLLPARGVEPSRVVAPRRFSEMLRFSLAIAVASAAWIAATQTDKLILSRMLPLSEYGYFSLAALMAGGILVVAGPISVAILPRLSRLEAAGDEAGVIRLYRDATQVVSIVAVPIALVLAFFPEEVLRAWVGDAAAVSKAAPVLALYAAGSASLVLGAFPYYLHHAKGQLKLHLAGSILFVTCLVPALVWATWRFGVIGAGWAWLITNLAYFLFWVPLAHRQLLPGLHVSWLVSDVAVTSLLPTLVAWGVHAVFSGAQDRVVLAFQLIGLGLLLLASSMLGSNTMRRLFVQVIGFKAAVRSERRRNDL